MFQGFERPCELILCILLIKKNEFDEIASLMFYVGEWKSELIICLLEVLKNDFGEVHGVIFMV
jgi:hypothetical protein